MTRRTKAEIDHRSHQAQHFQPVPSLSPNDCQAAVLCADR